MAIYDCFQYYNEDHIVDLRLNILDKFVDYFVISESTKTHQGKSKKLNFDIKNFSKFKNKIKYLVADYNQEVKFVNHIGGESPIEQHQRNYLMEGLKDALPDDFIVLSSEKEAKSLCEARVEESKDDKIPLNFVTQDSAFQSTTSEELNIIIKSDVHGSSEAIKNAIDQIKHDEVKPKILLSDIGMVTETDVTLAKASNAVIIAFDVKPSKEAKKRAEQEKILISSYNIIYEVLDFIKARMAGLLSPDVQETIIGSAEILEIFKVSKVGKVAGSKVVDGEITQNSSARVIRDGAIIFNGKIGSIFREKDQTKQVSAGLECGITLKDFADYQKKDIIEVYNSTITERTI